MPSLEKQIKTAEKKLEVAKEKLKKLLLSFLDLIGIRSLE
jgi:hypothetical protein